jgi:hypothetical protein
VEIVAAFRRDESDPAYSLAGQLTGLPLKYLQGFSVPAEPYGFASKRRAPGLGDDRSTARRTSPLRTAHLHDPGAQIQFASESFIDEIAAAIGADPVAFRLRYLKEPRDIAVVKAAAERAGWQPRPSPRPDRTGDTLMGRGIADRTGDTLMGRGIAYAQRSVPSWRSSPRSRSTAAAARSGRRSSPSRTIAG